MQHTLVGFSTELDWRPLYFLKPLPPNRVCSACGLVRPKTALLPCAHTLCEPCYGQCAEAGLHVCPLDGYEGQDEDVDWRELRADDVFRREVKCWNQGTGCDYVAPASRIAQHFHQDCGHHYVRCPKCSATVPCCNVVPHLKDCYCNSAMATKSDCEGHPDFKNATCFDCSLKGTFGAEVVEVKEFLRQIISQISAHGERLNEISHAINSFKETREHEASAEIGERHDSFARIMSKVSGSNQELKGVLFMGKIVKDEIGNAARKTVDKLSECASAIEAVKAAVQEKNEFIQKVDDHMKSIPRNSELGKTLCVFSVKDVKSLLQTAMKTGRACYEGELVYLRGYHLSPGVAFRKDGECLKLDPLLRLYKGTIDDVLQWPFQPRINLGVIHPKGGKDCMVQVSGGRSSACLQRPTACSNAGCACALDSINVVNLFKDGYVENDQMRVMFELLP
ncbi:TNF receptor-associated factor 6-like [Amblyomma americanum]